MNKDLENDEAIGQRIDQAAREGRAAKERDMRNLTKAYFDQGTQYYSQSGETLIRIKDMHPTYAANAARRLLQDAPTWAMEAEAQHSPARWMMNTKLWQTLTAQAQDKNTMPKLGLYQDDAGDIWVPNSGGGWRVAGDTDNSEVEFMSLEAVDARWGPLTPI